MATVPWAAPPTLARRKACPSASLSLASTSISTERSSSVVALSALASGGVLLTMIDTVTLLPALPPSPSAMV